MKKQFHKRVALSLVLLIAIFAITSGENQQAQKEAKASSFTNASVSTLLDWASREFNASFLYSPEKLNGAGESKMTFSTNEATTKAEKRILLFESLRELGLVPMPLRGMKSEVYRVVPIAEAAQLSILSEHIEDLDGYYFGTLAFRARVMPFEKLDEIIRDLASKDASIVAVKESSSFLVSDFVDALRTIDAAIKSADRKTSREDDLLAVALPVEKHDAAEVTRLLLASRTPTETYSAVNKRGTNVILVSGTREQVARVQHRVDVLEAAPVVKEVKLKLHTIDTRVIAADDLHRALSTYFAAEVAMGAMRFASVPQRDQVIVSANQADWQRVRDVYPSFDRLPENTTEERNTKRVEERRVFEKIKPKDD